MFPFLLHLSSPFKCEAITGIIHLSCQTLMIGSFQLNTWDFWGSCYIQPVAPPKQPSQNSRPHLNWVFGTVVHALFYVLSMHLTLRASLGLDIIHAMGLQRSGLSPEGTSQFPPQFHWAAYYSHSCIPTLVSLFSSLFASLENWLLPRSFSFHLSVICISPPSSPSAMATSSCLSYTALSLRISSALFLLTSSENLSEKPTSLFYF